MKRTVVVLGGIALLLGAWLHALPDVPPQPPQSASPAPLALTTGPSPPVASPTTGTADLRIPASFSGGARDAVLNLAQARALATRDPQMLMRADAFSSQAYKADLASFHIKPSDVVLDIGCGTGALEFRLLREGVAFKELYAADIDKQSLEFLDLALKLAPHPGCARMRTLRNTRDNIGLPASSVDVVIIYNTPVGATPPRNLGSAVPATDRPFIASLLRAMRPGARLHYTIFVAPDVFRSVRPLFEEVGFRTLQEKKSLAFSTNFLTLELERPVSP